MKKNLRHRNLTLPLALLTTITLLPLTSHADVITQTGANGANGSDGTNPYQSGGTGTNGTSEQYTSPLIGSNTVTLTGGNGGNGGTGSTSAPFNGGGGGAGGSATATLTINAGPSDSTNTITVTGGNGGDSGLDGVPLGTNGNSYSGNGGQAGSASANVTIVPTNLSANITANVTAIGGTTGSSTMDASEYGTVSGTLAVQAVPGASGNQTLSLTAIASNSGNDHSPMSALSFPPSLSLSNNVSGSTSGTLTLSQTAIAGAGEAGTQFSSSGGNAQSTLTLTDTSASTLNVTVTAVGGAAGRNLGDTAFEGDGGNAASSVNITGAHDVNVAAIAVGGKNSDNAVILMNPQLPSLTIVSATAFGASTGGGTVTVSATVIGSVGGDSINGGTVGNGGSADIDNAVSGSTSGSLILNETAIGGNMGVGAGSGPGGGRSQLVYTNTDASSLTGTVNAMGGQDVADGGYGITTISLTGAHLVQSAAYSTAGVGATGTAAATSTSNAGTSSALAVVKTLSPQLVANFGTQDRATAIGTGLNIASSIRLNAGGVGMLFASSTMGIPAVPLSSASNAQAYVLSNAHPLAADVAAAEAGTVNVSAAFPLTGPSPLAIATLGSQAPATLVAGNHAGYTISTYLSGAPTNSAADELVGISSATFTGTGSMAILFTIGENGTTPVSDTFTSAADAAAFLNDKVFDIGPISSLNVTITLQVNFSAPGQSFALTGLISDTAAVPEPASLTLLAAGATRLLNRRRR